MKIKKKYLAYLFDLDGTLVDSEKLKAKALVETFSTFGAKLDASVYKFVMGESWAHVTNHFFKIAKIKPDFEIFNTKFREIYRKLLHEELTPNPNVVELLQILKINEKKIGLVSSSSSWMVDQVLSQLNLSDYFDVVVTNEHVTHYKPDPEAYLLALKKLSLSASEVLVFEDSKSGLLAASSAKCDSIAFRHEFNRNNDFSLAIRIISDYKELIGAQDWNRTSTTKIGH